MLESSVSYKALETMSFERYEDEFRSTLQQLTTEIQGLKDKRGGPAHRRAEVTCEGLVSELKEMQQDLDVSVCELSGTERNAATARIANYKRELKRLCEEMKFAKQAADNAEGQAMFAGGDDPHTPTGEAQSLVFDQQRTKLNSGTNQLRSALAEIRETEEVGLGIMEQLAHDRETIGRVDRNIGRSDESLSRSSTILRRMRNMDIRGRIITVVLGLILFACVIVLLLVFAGVIG